MSATPIHHPAGELLLGAAAGELCPGLHLAVSAHCGLCQPCAATMRGYEAVADALVPSLNAGSETIAPKFSEEALRVDPILGDLPEPVDSLAAEALAKGAWEPFSPGITALNLDSGAHLRQDKAQVAIVCVEAGIQIPEHDHAGTEALVILAGGFTDHRGSFHRGDISILTRGDIHGLQIHHDEACYWLFTNDEPLLSELLAEKEAQKSGAS